VYTERARDTHMRKCAIGDRLTQDSLGGASCRGSTTPLFIKLSNRRTLFVHEIHLEGGFSVARRLDFEEIDGQGFSVRFVPALCVLAAR